MRSVTTLEILTEKTETIVDIVSKASNHIEDPDIGYGKNYVTMVAHYDDNEDIISVVDTFVNNFQRELDSNRYKEEWVLTVHDQSNGYIIKDYRRYPEKIVVTTHDDKEQYQSETIVLPLTKG